MGWAADEFKEIKLGDKRLDKRMIKLCDTLSESPESPINQACEDWGETKAAYRFFNNENVDSEQILSVHRTKTAERATKEETILVAQDTSYFIYSNHVKTKGLGDLGYKKGNNDEKIYSKGLGAYFFSPNNPKHGTQALPDVTMYAIHALEQFPPEGETPIEWILLTNIPVTTLDEAKEKIHWYSMRWRIEMFFKILKSGFKVESCRLGDSKRLIRYLTVMSIIAWRLFMITLIARTDPTISCSIFLSDSEWKVLGLKMLHQNISSKPPTISEAVILIAKLGGFLARKSDGSPGTLVLWRGWKKLIDLAEGWELARRSDTCG